MQEGPEKTHGLAAETIHAVIVSAARSDGRHVTP